MAAVWTEVCTLAVVDQFAESRGRINLGLLHALARAHALLYRNSYCLVLGSYLAFRSRPLALHGFAARDEARFAIDLSR